MQGTFRGTVGGTRRNLGADLVHCETRQTSLSGIGEEDPSDVVVKSHKLQPLRGGVSAHCCAYARD